MKQFVTDLSDTLAAALRGEAIRRNLATGWTIRVTMEIQSPVLFHVQRTGCDQPVIAIAFDFAASLTPKEKPRFLRLALDAIRFANRMAISNPLVTGDLAYQMGQERKKLRRVPIMTSLHNSLPDRYFRVSSVVSVTCALSGRTLSADVPFNGSFDATVAMLQNELSRQLLLDRDSEALIDLLESARQARQPDVPKSVTISDVGYGERTTVTYHPNISTHNPQREEHA